MPPEDIAGIVITGLITVAVALVFVLRGPVGRALARRIEGAAGSDAQRVGELERRVAELEAAGGRIAELEERLDFAERMLARGANASARLGAGE